MRCVTSVSSLSFSLICSAYRSLRPFLPIGVAIDENIEIISCHVLIIQRKHNSRDMAFIVHSSLARLIRHVLWRCTCARMCMCVHWTASAEIEALREKKECTSLQHATFTPFITLYLFESVYISLQRLFSTVFFCFYCYQF